MPELSVYCASRRARLTYDVACVDIGQCAPGHALVELALRRADKPGRRLRSGSTASSGTIHASLVNPKVGRYVRITGFTPGHALYLAEGIVEGYVDGACGQLAQVPLSIPRELRGMLVHV